MKAVAIAVRRPFPGLPGQVVVRVGVALGYSLALLTGVGLGLWLIFGLIGLRPTSG
ncbi:MAG: hypothetical protein AB7P34_16465 [Vicinamibacterales bacterium]